MKLSIIKIGNSRGIRLPKPVLDQLGADDLIEMEVQSDRLILRAPKLSRTGWDEQFKRLAKQNNAQPNGWEAASSDWDESGWKWD